MAQITGNLNDPMGNGIVGVTIKITSDNTETVLYGLTSTNVTAIGGLYDFNLNFGTYLIEVLLDGIYIRTAVVVVDATVPNVLTLETLITDHAKFVPSTIDS